MEYVVNLNNKEKALEAMATICSDKMLSEIMVNGTESAGYEVKNYTPISNDCIHQMEQVIWRISIL